MKRKYDQLQGMEIIAVAPTAVYLRLPKPLQRPIEGGCQCRYCLSHPDALPMWDTLGVPTSPTPRSPYRNTTWTVHAPEWTADKPYRFKPESTVQRDHMETGQ